MGYKGTIRSIQAEINRSRRAAEQRERAVQRALAAQSKMAEVERAALEVEAYEARLAVLQSVHHEVSQGIDWSDVAKTPGPPPPQPVTRHQREAQARLDAFKPSSIMKKRSERQREALEAEVDKAQEVDLHETEVERRAHADRVTEWEQTIALANRILDSDVAAFGEALALLQPFSDVEALGSSVDVSFLSPTLATATVHVAGESMMPKEVKRQLASGKLSTKQMTKTDFYALYQDYICSCVLRVASEITHLFPTEAVVVTAVDRLVDTATGHLGEVPILSVAIPEATLATLNMPRIDPSDALANFVHNMSFKKTAGFQPVGVIDPDSLALDQA